MCYHSFSGHPPPGDFIALGSKSQTGEPKAPPVLLKPASTGLPADRKRETSSTLPSSSGLSTLTKRPKLATTPPVMSPAVLLDEIEAAESEGNDDRVEGLLCGAVRQLKMNRAKPDITLYLSLMFLAKIKPNVFATQGIIEVYIEDSLGERIWVDSSHCKTFVDNIQTAFATKMPPKSMLLQAESGRTPGDLSAGGVCCKYALI
ncbi:hypothetical protein GOODEAATRI_000819 [Goodea atripinnis]|uniref:Uncharacterized protein n=1 Tax=Goodea atripinnis TaxID=208336 RepID=A0ABV0NGG6_9TELE